MFNQGHLGMRVELDRDVYFPGDEVKMKLEVSNESVKKARKDPLAFCFVASRLTFGLLFKQVTGINVDLRRHMTLRAHHHRFSHSDNAQHLRLEVLAAHPSPIAVIGRRLSKRVFSCLVHRVSRRPRRTAALSSSASRPTSLASPPRATSSRVWPTLRHSPHTTHDTTRTTHTAHL